MPQSTHIIASTQTNSTWHLDDEFVSKLVEENEILLSWFQRRPESHQWGSWNVPKYGPPQAPPTEPQQRSATQSHSQPAPELLAAPATTPVTAPTPLPHMRLNFFKRTSSSN